MRIWHTKLIDVLPREQLVAQWRELSAIAGSIKQKETPNHLLVNFVLDYDYDHFISYAAWIRDEMTHRGYKTMNSVWDKIESLKPEWELIEDINDIYPQKMDRTYFLICFSNLEEKYLCGGISEQDWQRINESFIQYMGVALQNRALIDFSEVRK